MTNIRLLDRLPCIRLPFSVSGGPCLVPLPCKDVAWKILANDSLKKHLIKARNVVIEHPDSEIAALAYLDGLSIRGEIMVLEFQIITRVRVREETREVVDGMEYTRFHFIDNISPSKEHFSSNEFRQKFDLLKELLVRIFVSPAYAVTGELVDTRKINLEGMFSQRGVSADTVGDFLDEAVMRATSFFAGKNEQVESCLIDILEEPNVEVRLDLAISFADWLLEDIFGELWEGVPNEEYPFDENENQKVPVKITEPKGDDEEGHPIERSALARKLLLGENRDPSVIVPKIKNGEPVVIAKGNKLPRADNLDLPGFKDFAAYLEQRVIGQSRPLHNVSNLLNLAAAGLVPQNKPLGVFFFAGPTGTGKTETAEAIADFLYEREKKIGLNYKAKPLVRVDSGIYEGTVGGAITQLIGSSAGYVGSKGDKDGAQRPVFLKENFPTNRITVLLFDEIEKAFKDSGPGIPFAGNKIGNLLVTLLDKGNLFNAWDEWVDFSRTIFIFTSNIGAVEIVKRAKKGSGIGYHFSNTPSFAGTGIADENVERLNNDIFKIVKAGYEKAFAPEFRGRINQLVVFRFHTREDFRAILLKEIKIFESELKAEHGISIRLEESVIDWILNYGTSREAGVRFLQEFLKVKIREEIAKYILAGVFSVGDVVRVVSESPNNRDVDPIFFLE